MVDTRYVFSAGLPFDQRLAGAIVDYVTSNGHATVPLDGSVPFWTSCRARKVVKDTVPPGLRRMHPQNYEYFLRLVPGIEWEWSDAPIGAMVRELLSPALHLYARLTRIKVFLQMAGEAIPPHRDLAAGNTYDGMLTATSVESGPHRLTYAGDAQVAAAWSAPDSDVHRAQGYLALKIPLSERPGEHGRPYVEVGGRRTYYDPGDGMYFLNECEMLHGADPVPYRRGVIFVDGMLDMARVNALVRTPVREIS
jgi:hypothetical protein